MNLRKIKIYFFSLVLSVLLIAPAMNVMAEVTCPSGLKWNDNSGLCLPEKLPYDKGVAGATNLVDLIKTVIEYLLFMSGMVAVVFIIVGGFWYVTSAGNAEQAEKGQKALINAIIGLVVVILSYAIVQVVANLITKARPA